MYFLPLNGMISDMERKKKAAIFDVHDDCDVRLKYVSSVLEQNGYETDIYLPDFDHYAKAYRTKLKEGIHYIHITPYQKNFSFARIRSFQGFAASCREIAQERQYNLVYAIIPPNSMVKEFSSLKEKKPDVTVIYEIKDMWPETFPSEKIQKAAALPFHIWRNIRNKTLNIGDVLITECDLFQSLLQKQTGIDRFHTIYLCNTQKVKTINVPAKPLTFVYLGSINHVIDIDRIVAFLQAVQVYEPVKLEIIGEGDNRDLFLHALDQGNIPYDYHGLIFAEEKKKEILSHCHYGLNFFKNTACVGLTMKSLDYMAYDLPFINTIPGDTERIVKEEHIGFHLDDLKQTAEHVHLCSDEEYRQMKQNVIDTHEKYFSPDVFQKKLEEILPK
jgi:hypothetical protein